MTIVDHVSLIAFLRAVVGERVCLIHDRGKAVGTLVHVGACDTDEHDAVLVVELPDETRTRLHVSEVERVKLSNPDSTRLRKDRRK